MRGSVTIVRIFGTTVRMHLTFLILLAWIAIGEALTRGTEAALTGTIFVLLLFACVVAHEFGHVLVARHYGIYTRDILLLPIGGVSQMERMPERPAQELAVAIAGPAVSIAIGAFLTMLVGFPTAETIGSPALEDLLPRLAATNLFLALFNLLPAFPMDGGRALRALLAMRIDRVRATQIAAYLGHIIASLFVLFGLVSPNPLLLLIGIFIYFGASAEAADTELRRLAQTLTVADVMRSNVRALASTASIVDAISLMLQAGQQVIPVIGPAGNLLGIATKDRIIRAVHRSGRAALVNDALEPNVITVPSHLKLADALEKMQGQSTNAIIVVGPAGDIAGILTSDTLADLIMMESAAEKANSRALDAGAPLAVSVPKSV